MLKVKHYKAKSAILKKLEECVDIFYFSFVSNIIQLTNCIAHDEISVASSIRCSY